VTPLSNPPKAPAWFLWVLAAGVFCLDRWTKHWALAALAPDPTRPVLGDLLRFTYVRNRGVAFGLFAERGWPLGWVSLLALAAVLWLAWRPSARRWSRAASLGLILGGALGNLVDRVHWGSVVDFIDVGIGRHRFWVFNVADASITLGVCLWAAQLLLPHAPAAPSDAAAPASSAELPSDDARGA
jgi:signal peptidase II